MTINDAYKFIEFQNRQIRKVNGLRIVYGNCEYRITYFGGFGAYVGIDYRQVGKRNFKYFNGFGAYDCLTCGEVLKRIEKIITNKNGE